MTYSISLIPPAALDIVAVDTRVLLDPAIEYCDGRMNIHTVYAQVLTGEYQLWLAFSDDKKIPVGALITRIERYPLKTMLNFLLCGGDELDGWHEAMLETLAKFAKAQLCDGMELIGRRGWGPFLRDHGWDVKHVVCEITFDQVEKILGPKLVEDREEVA